MFSIFHLTKKKLHVLEYKKQLITSTKEKIVMFSSPVDEDQLLCLLGATNCNSATKRVICNNAYLILPATFI